MANPKKPPQKEGGIARFIFLAMSVILLSGAGFIIALLSILLGEIEEIPEVGRLGIIDWGLWCQGFVCGFFVIWRLFSDSAWKSFISFLVWITVYILVIGPLIWYFPPSPLGVALRITYAACAGFLMCYSVLYHRRRKKSPWE